METIPTVTTVNPKGQATIPEPPGERSGSPPGTKGVWRERDGDLLPKSLPAVEQLRGRFQVGVLTAAPPGECAAARKHEDG